jgi:hypothetical protein
MKDRVLQDLSVTRLMARGSKHETNYQAVATEEGLALVDENWCEGDVFEIHLQERGESHSLQSR